jgi:hypothetical protein
MTIHFLEMEKLNLLVFFHMCASKNPGDRFNFDNELLNHTNLRRIKMRDTLKYTYNTSNSMIYEILWFNGDSRGFSNKRYLYQTISQIYCNIILSSCHLPLGLPINNYKTILPYSILVTCLKNSM